jgi:hypothetical protein
MSSGQPLTVVSSTTSSRPRQSVITCRLRPATLSRAAAARSPATAHRSGPRYSGGAGPDAGLRAPTGKPHRGKILPGRPVPQPHPAITEQAHQRTYSWKQQQHARLWGDVLKLAEDRAAGHEGATHFIGSLVLAPSPGNGPSGSRSVRLTWRVWTPPHTPGEATRSARHGLRSPEPPN